MYARFISRVNVTFLASYTKEVKTSSTRQSQTCSRHSARAMGKRITWESTLGIRFLSVSFNRIGPVADHFSSRGPSSPLRNVPFQSISSRKSWNTSSKCVCMYIVFTLGVYGGAQGE